MGKKLEPQLKMYKNIDEAHLCAIRREEEYWSQILEHLIAFMRVLSGQNLEFHGTNENFYNVDNGTFLKFIEYLV